MTAPLPKGYKRTEVGVIPEEWGIKSLGEIAQIISGGTPSTQNPDYWDGGIMWCTPSDVTATSGKYLETTERTISQKGLQNSSAHLLPPGTLLLCSRATIGDVKIATQPTATNQGFKSLVIDAEQADNEFVYYQLLTLKNNLIQRGVGSTFLEVSRKDVASLFIPLPPLPEQRAIAAALADVDSLLASFDRLIAKKRAVQAAAMRDLLTGRVRLPGFEGEWETRKLGEIFRLEYGKSQKGIVMPDGIYPILATSGEVGRTNQFLYDKPSIVIGRKGTIDTPRYVDVPFWAIDTTFYTIIRDGYSPKFLFYLLSTINWQGYNEASGVPSLNANTIYAIRVTLPILPTEQTAIAAALSDLDAELAALERERAKWQSVKQGMMDALLTGRVRLV